MLQVVSSSGHLPTPPPFSWFPGPGAETSSAISQEPKNLPLYLGSIITQL